MPTESQPTTAELLARCAAGTPDGSVWDAFVERIQRRVRGGVIAALTRCGEPPDPDLVDDLVQEVWCRLLERDRRILQHCRGTSEGEIVTYLRRVAGSVVIDALRARGALKRRAGELVSISVESDRAHRLIDRAGCPERRAIAAQTFRSLLQACRRALGPKSTSERLRIARLGLIEGWSSVEIARLFDGTWTRHAIDSTLYRVRCRLADLGVRLPRRPGGRAGAARPRRLRPC